MGTRGIVGLRIDGKDKLSYNHWDSYPDGLGADVVAFLKVALKDRATLDDRARKLEVVTRDTQPTPEQIGSRACSL